MTQLFDLLQQGSANAWLFPPAILLRALHARSVWEDVAVERPFLRCEYDLQAWRRVRRRR